MCSSSIEVASSIATFTELEPLLRDMTRRAPELLQAEGCSLLLLDEGPSELFFPLSSQMTSREATAAEVGRATV